MILSVNDQAVLFLHIFCAGGAAGMLYDLIEVLRTNIKHKKSAVYIEDGFYWLAVIMLIFLFMLNENYGEIRPFAVAGFFAGMLVYNIIFSRVVTKALNMLINIVKWILKLLFEIIMTPIRLVWLVIGKPVAKTGTILAGCVKKLLHSGGVYAKIRKRDMINQLKFIKSRAKNRANNRAENRANIRTNKRDKKRGPRNGKD